MPSRSSEKNSTVFVICSTFLVVDDHKRNHDQTWEIKIEMKWWPVLQKSGTVLLSTVTAFFPDFSSSSAFHAWGNSFVSLESEAK